MMEMYMFQIMGPFLGIMGIGVLLNYKRTMNMSQDMWDSKGLVFVMAMMSLLFGLLIVTGVMTLSGWETWIVYVLGWAAVVKGVMLMRFPKHMKKLSLSMMKGNDFFMQVWVFALALFGLWLTWMGYIG